MKTYLFILSAFLFNILNTAAQAPEAFSYQAVVRDASGTIIQNQAVAFRISILQTATTGVSVYSETHNITTNDFGLANLQIGTGTVVSGNMSTIDWGATDYFVQVDLDASGGTNYQTMGTSQLLSVPFAMYAQTSGDKVWDKNGNDAYYTDGKVGIGTTNPLAPLSIEGPAINGRETLVDIRNSDGTDRFSLENGTTSPNTFIPTLTGVLSSSTNFHSLALVANTIIANDVGTTPLMVFDSRKSPTAGPVSPGGAAITVRPLFEWRSYTNVKMTMTANGNLGIGTSTPARKLHVTEAMRLEPTATAPSNPSAGDMYFSSVNNKLMVYDGTTWQACW